MEARGFGGAARTWARPSTFSGLDVWVLLGGLLIAAAAVAAAVSAGTWNMVFLAPAVDRLSHDVGIHVTLTPFRPELPGSIDHAVIFSWHDSTDC